MKTLQVNSNPVVVKVFENYPLIVQVKMKAIRNLILETAKEMHEVNALEEALKWGEPSYITKHGSTLRMDWKAKNPNQYAMYFKCTSRLVETFKSIYPNFEYEGTRAIVFQLDDEIPISEIKECIKATLNYHKVKHLPNLGISLK